MNKILFKRLDIPDEEEEEDEFEQDEMGDHRSNEDANEGGEYAEGKAPNLERQPTMANKAHNTSQEDEDAS